MNDTITFSVKEVQDFLEVCGVKSTERMINKILESKGCVKYCIRMIYLIMLILDTKKSKKNNELSLYLQRIIPKSKKFAENMFPQISEFLNLSEKIEVIEKDINGNEIITYKNKELAVKKVLDFSETKGIERKVIKEKLINKEEKIDNTPITIKKIKEVVRYSKGLLIKYPFRCAICNVTHSNGYIYKIANKEFEICKFCVNDIKDKCNGTKLIYTPMGNKR